MPYSVKNPQTLIKNIKEKVSAFANDTSNHSTKDGIIAQKFVSQLEKKFSLTLQLRITYNLLTNLDDRTLKNELRSILKKTFSIADETSGTEQEKAAKEIEHIGSSVRNYSLGTLRNLPSEVLQHSLSFLSLTDLGIFSRVNTTCKTNADIVISDKIKEDPLLAYPLARTPAQLKQDLTAKKEYQQFVKLFRKYKNPEEITEKRLIECTASSDLSTMFKRDEWVVHLEKAIKLGDLIAIFNGLVINRYGNIGPLKKLYNYYNCFETDNRSIYSLFSREQNTKNPSIEVRDEVSQIHAMLQFSKKNENAGRLFYTSQAQKNGWPVIIFQILNTVVVESENNITKKLLSLGGYSSALSPIEEIFETLKTSEPAPESLIDACRIIAYLNTILNDSSAAAKKLAFQFNICYHIAKETQAVKTQDLEIAFNNITKNVEKKNFTEIIALLEQRCESLIKKTDIPRNCMNNRGFIQAKKIGETHAEQYLAQLVKSQPQKTPTCSTSTLHS